MSPFTPWSEYSSGPIAVEGGIKAKSKRGAIGEQWWSRRFLAVLESFGMTGRLQRGRNYARRGQVLEFSLAAGKVAARVQGSRPTPYKVTLAVRPLTAAQWQKVESRLAAQALFRARLLAGEMPAEIEQVFADEGTPLFPESSRDLTMDCNCPDWGYPCKHVAAVCYVLAEAFDDDPFAMLAWRGKSRDDLLAALRRPAASGAGSGAAGGAAGSGTAGRVPASGPGGPPDFGSPATAVLSDVTGQPLEESLADFWSPGLSQARLRATPPSPATPADLLLRVAEPPPALVRGQQLRDLLTPAYAALAAQDESVQSLAVSVLKGVLGLFARVLQVAGDLVLLTFGCHVRVVGVLADGLLGLTHHLLGSVPGLVHEAHTVCSHFLVLRRCDARFRFPGVSRASG
jgi:uncharacterized Zn finger protein